MVNSLWFQWKSLKLPWRKSRIAGVDLAGNTFWEYRDDPNANRWRRMLKPDPKIHLSDVQVTPQWHQWLRYVREHPPTVEEQQQDVVRQLQIKQLARLADERWASKPSYLDKPQPQNPIPSVGDGSGSLKSQNLPHSTQSATPSQTESASQPTPPKEANPWAKADRSNPGDSWQPSDWSPNSKR
ncbi:NADH:ubiquinone oxidoreductase 17.2kDa subunit [Penicillium waksmanii]|uniref:NADH:ubiquinone oxidoreductase 17.2kDa subunit n=1 Tax=Penicillium waksmanii TaxID=69791 RepID=UPI00254842DC|nr:NADH:ubiquinone oxidoreductase 17.2kDa subunit [Penicillium waksmanii]KAJ5976085.1 NADH:ubiquinone oxidoreductase 17.2kDa subunit [Penicillium waksmanii]